ncbi:MAG: hypothetical protein ACFFC6_03570 [Promethearchaeota archaeon]
MPKEKLVIVKADIEKNRLYTTLKGNLSKEDILSLPEDLRCEAKRLKPGYLAISDVSAYTPVSEENLEILSETMGVAVETKMGATIRIVSGTSMDLQQVSSSNHGYKAIICQSKDEAEKIAEKLKRSINNI